MKKFLETLGGLLVVGGAAAIVHRFVGWAPFGIVVRPARATPVVRDHELVAYVALIVVGLALLVASGKVDDSADEAEAQDTRPEPRG